MQHSATDAAATTHCKRKRAPLLILLAVTFGIPIYGYCCEPANIRYASSGNRIYVENGGSCTLSEIDSLIISKYSSVSPNQLLEQTAPAQWLLKAEILIEDGSTLALHGTSVGGDVNLLRLLSRNGSQPYHVKIQARHGIVEIVDSVITSWDTVAAGPDTQQSNGRAYIHVNSLKESGIVKESRMDIIDSEIAYLGYNAAESYGLVWKVRGGESNHAIYDEVEVYGEIRNSYIHHNYMGMYSFGAFGLLIDNSEFAFNTSYGIDPHDDSDELVITNNNVHDNGNHGIICSRRCNNLVITGNHSYRNRHGIMLHRETNDSLIDGNVVYDNEECGIAVFESHNNIISNNVFSGNQHGVRFSLGSHDNLVESNTIEDNIENGIYQFAGSDPPETTNGRPANNVFRENLVRNNGKLMKLRESDNLQLVNNVFEGATDVEIYNSTNILMEGNTHLFASLNIRVDGDSTQPSSVKVELYEPASVKLTANVSLELFTRTGQLLDATENSDQVTFTQVSENGASYTEGTLLLNSAIIGSSTTVTPQPFQVSVPAGSIQISGFSFSNQTAKWKAMALDEWPLVTYAIGNLTSGADYQLSRDNNPISTLTAFDDSVVFDEFADPAVHSYKVAPLSP